MCHFLRGDNMEGCFLTHRGKVRSHNEDSGGIYYSSNDQILAIIADGMGGHQAGDVASQMATSLIQKKWGEMEKLDQPDASEKWLSTVIAELNKSIFDYSLKNTEYEGMGTTIVIAICTHEFITIAHIGDSRCYLLNENGFMQITEDHSLVNELLRAGQITKDDAEHHPRKNILLKALGTEEAVAEDVQTISWEEGNKLLLCSDGLTNKLSDEELKEFIQSGKDLKQTGLDMIQLANDRGGEDNISLIILDHTPSLEEGEEE